MSLEDRIYERKAWEYRGNYYKSQEEAERARASDNLAETLSHISLLKAFDHDQLADAMLRADERFLIAFKQRRLDKETASE